MTRAPVPSRLRRVLGVPPACPTRFYVFYRLGQLLGINSHVSWPVHFSTQVNYPRRVSLGYATYPGDSRNCYISAFNGIEIGDFTNLGPGVGLISANHNPYDNMKWDEAPPLRLGKFCWIGMHAVILPGVELGDFTIVGAGSVVTKSFPDGFCVLAGNPARKLRDLDREKCLQMEERRQEERRAGSTFNPYR